MKETIEGWIKDLIIKENELIKEAQYHMSVMDFKRARRCMEKLERLEANKQRHYSELAKL
ncbi:hypothetical protein P5763_07445 [Bacillus cereus]|uniref:hypothetical protein n=1 Tax=Bacillus cereus TaxID=1396 RepID=UPI0024065401|nr:hypothetical protein [Bacillus cereus]MDF9611906.1 hypothetical protein [Bacillus cereus]